MKLLLIASILATSIYTFGMGQTLPDNQRPTDPEKTIWIGRSVFHALVGTADKEQLTEYLSNFGYQPLLEDGEVTVGIGVSVNTDVEGCGCPEAYNEFSVFYRVEKSDPSLAGDEQIIFSHAITDQPERQTSMVTKFQTRTLVGDTNKTLRGFFVKDDEGNPIVEFVGRRVWPVRILPKRLSLGVSTLGEKIGETQLGKIFYRAEGFSWVGLRNYDATRDQLVINPDSEVGQHLTAIGFTPKQIVIQDSRDSLAWLPH